MILAIDVSHDLGLITLELPDGELFTRSSDRPREHMDFLGRALAELSRETGRPWSELKSVAVAIGPGSFTGLRVGLATAKGLVFGRDLPLAPLPSLLVPARAHTHPHPIAAPLLVCRRSRGQEYWAALFVPANGREEAMPASAWPEGPLWEERLEAGQLQARVRKLAEADSATWVVGALPELPGGGEDWLLPLAPEPPADAQLAALAKLAREAKNGLRGPDADRLLPRYLAAPAITPGKGRRATPPRREESP